jgi:hypothetical protein
MSTGNKILVADNVRCVESVHIIEYIALAENLRSKA